MRVNFKARRLSGRLVLYLSGSRSAFASGYHHYCSVGSVQPVLRSTVGCGVPFLACVTALRGLEISGRSNGLKSKAGRYCLGNALGSAMPLPGYGWVKQKRAVEHL